jgi:hypothetical protein
MHGQQNVKIFLKKCLKMLLFNSPPQTKNNFKKNNKFSTPYDKDPHKKQEVFNNS